MFPRPSASRLAAFLACVLGAASAAVPAAQDPRFAGYYHKRGVFSKKLNAGRESLGFGEDAEKGENTALVKELCQRPIETDRLASWDENFCYQVWNEYNRIKDSGGSGLAASKLDPLAPKTLNLGGGLAASKLDPLAKLQSIPGVKGLIYEGDPHALESLLPDAKELQARLRKKDPSSTITVHQELVNPSPEGIKRVEKQFRELVGETAAGSDLPVDFLKVDIDSVDCVLLDNLLQHSSLKPTFLSVEITTDDHYPPPLLYKTVRVGAEDSGRPANASKTQSSVSWYDGYGGGTRHSLFTGCNLAAFVDIATKHGLEMFRFTLGDVVFIRSEEADRLSEKLLSKKSLADSGKRKDDTGLERFLRARQGSRYRGINIFDCYLAAWTSQYVGEGQNVGGDPLSALLSVKPAQTANRLWWNDVEPWPGHCRAFRPMPRAKDEKKVRFGVVNATAAAETGREIGISLHPLEFLWVTKGDLGPMAPAAAVEATSAARTALAQHQRDSRHLEGKVAGNFRGSSGLHRLYRFLTETGGDTFRFVADDYGGHKCWRKKTLTVANPAGDSEGGVGFVRGRDGLPRVDGGSTMVRVADDVPALVDKGRTLKMTVQTREYAIEIST